MGGVEGAVVATDPREALRDLFGYEGFRPHQEEIVRQVLAGRDVLGVLPTGAGKSLCFQLPAMLLPRPTLVVSPLIALMKDQVDGLPAAVYPRATLVNSSVEAEELNRRYGGMEAGRYQLVYVAPERLRQQGFLRLLERVGPSMVVVDEAHCVSMWGHDFRPDYLYIRKALARLADAGRAPVVMALTATATPEMRREIAGQLGREMEVVAASTYRPNLRFEVLPCATQEAKTRELAAVCRATPGAAIVYVNSRERCERLAAYLRRQGLPAAFYHAGLEREAREQTQERFMLGKVRVMVATVAFGMGVDKANVRLVAHFSLPESLEAYTQEAGRAGRDGKPSRCVLLYSPSDKGTLARWLRREELTVATVRDVYRALQAQLGREAGWVSAEALERQVFGSGSDDGSSGSRLRVAIAAMERCGMLARHADAGRDLWIEMLNPPRSARADLEALLAQRRRHAERRLERVVAYAEGSGCRHAAIASHFGQELEPCGSSCDGCLGTRREPEAARERPLAPTAEQVPDLGRAILEAVPALPFALGRTGLARLLAGADTSPIPRERCESFGRLAGFTLKALREAMDRLIALGLLTIHEGDEYYRLQITPAGHQALADRRVLVPNPLSAAPNRPSAARRAAGSVSAARMVGGAGLGSGAAAEDEDDRFERLRAWRQVEARRANLPPYCILQDSVLRAVARSAPDTLDGLAALPGIGPTKLGKYGRAVLDLLHGGGE